MNIVVFALSSIIIVLLLLVRFFIKETKLKVLEVKMLKEIILMGGNQNENVTSREFE